MKNILLKSVAALSVSLFATGCIEETFPQGATQVQSQVSKSESALVAMVNAIPVAMTSVDVTGYLSNYNDHGDFGLPSIHIKTEMMLEDLATQSENPYTNRFYFYVENFGMDSRSWPSAYFWTAYYIWIKSCNDIISLVNPDDATPETIGYLGQALAYRAMCYLDLARLYEPKENKYTDVSGVLGLTVPIITEKTTEAEAKNNPRATRKDMYDFILTDLKNAAKYLEGQNYSYTRPTLMAVYGLMARAYLEMGYWVEGGDKEAFAEAASYARKVIDESGKSPLTKDQWEDPVNGFNNGSANTSWIWGLPVSGQNIGNIISFTAHMSTEGTFGIYGRKSQYGASKSFYERINYDDFRKYTWLDPNWEEFDGSLKYDYKFAGTDQDKRDYIDGKGQFEPAKAYMSLKFRPAQGELGDYSVGGAADHPIMRIEEMYFIEMEAKAHLDLADAQNLLAEFMKFRYTTGTYSVPPAASDLSGFLDEMLFQKRVEFWGEGILFYDYKRLGRGITRGYQGSNHATAFQYNSDGRSPLWNIVITRSEFQANVGITDATNNPDPSNTIKLWDGK